MYKKRKLKINDVYEELTEWFNNENCEKIIEIGLYNDYVKSVSLSTQFIKIEISDRIIYIFEGDLKNLKIDEKYNILVFDI